MGIRERRERERADLRQRIMDAARQLFVEQGVESVSMRRIADAIEYSPASIYAHFKDKADLLMALCQADFGALSAGLVDIATNTPDPVERIRLFGLAYCRFAADHPCHYRLMFMTPSYNPPEGAPLPDKGNPDVDGYAMLRRATEDAIAAGRVRPDYADPELLAQTFWAAVHGVASLQIAKHNDPWLTWRPYDQRCEVMVAAILDGLTLPPRDGNVATDASPWVRPTAKPRSPRKKGVIA